MRLAYSILLVVFLLTGCAVHKNQNQKVSLHFLDEYVIPSGKLFNTAEIGGLSGIEYANGMYYLVVDDPKSPRYFIADISIEDTIISNIKIKEIVHLNNDPYYKNHTLDLESIIVDTETSSVIIASEGKIRKGKKPVLFSSDYQGKFKKDFQLPKRFTENNPSQLIHNKTLEGLSMSYDHKGYWTGMELPLKSDGEEPSYLKSDSPVRITYFEKTSGIATKEYVLPLSPITRKYKGDMNLNGLTDILEFKEGHFFVIERTYQSGFGVHGNIVRIYHAYADENTTNTLYIDYLNEKSYVPLQKELVFDFENIKDQLTEKTVDNIEGITFGPILPNGNQSLLLVSDDNFQVYGKQLNQFILLEIKK